MAQEQIKDTEQVTTNCFCKTKEMPTAKIRWKQLTYALIYTAFFGNMVYDFVDIFMTFANMPTKYGAIKLATGAFLLFFFMLDYVHLNIDLEFVVTDEKKDWEYMLWDIFTSLLFFLAMAMLKYKHAGWAVVAICFVPAIFARYNLRLPLGLKWHKQIHWSYGTLGVALFVYFLITHKFLRNESYIGSPEAFLLLVVSILSTLYLCYNLIFFWYSKSIWIYDYRKII